MSRFVVISFPFFPHSWLTIEVLTKVRPLVPWLGRNCLPFRNNLVHPNFICGAHIAQYLVVFCRAGFFLTSLYIWSWYCMSLLDVMLLIIVCVVFCRSMFVLTSLYFLSLYSLSLLDLWLIIIHLATSIVSYYLCLCFSIITINVGKIEFKTLFLNIRQASKKDKCTI